MVVSLQVGLCIVFGSSATGMTLDEALVQDILPPPSAKCLGAKADGDFTFSFDFKPLPKGHWHDMNVSIVYIYTHNNVLIIA